jgi:hypothetical protein
MVKQLTFNQLSESSSLSGPTKFPVLVVTISQLKAVVT